MTSTNKVLRLIRRLFAFAALMLSTGVAQAAERQNILLDGTWRVAESLDGTRIPPHFDGRAPVPGLVHSAKPSFIAVDRFESRSFLANMVFNKLRPASDLTSTTGISHQLRNFFWYRTGFDAPVRRGAAFLKINKAQFGSELWINGRRIGGSVGCAASRIYDISDVVHWSSRNTVTIRIGAHPGVLPIGAPCGIDMEKTRWTPGIYDSVSVFFTDAVTIETTQVAPHISPLGITVQTILHNRGAIAATVPLRLVVRGWKDVAVVARAERHIMLPPGGREIVTQEIALPGAQLWSPEAAHLYVVDSLTAGDNVTTRFGLREFRFDTATRSAYLNGKPYFLRGSNIALHRFFEDPLSSRLPWNDAWVAKLLGSTAKSMHWNAMRMTIGPVPDRWLDIADEQGLILQQEFPIWNSKLIGTANPTFDSESLVNEFAGWMRDGWNHPSVAIWDASNETELPQLARDVILNVRSLDLSGRAWENSYNPPVDANDPVEDHPYEFVNNEYPTIGPPFDMVQLEGRGGAERSERTVPTGHAMILNEYGWLWLNRDGSPTQLTGKIYRELPYPVASAEDRLRTQAYLLAGLTEYWRAYRRYAGVMHFVYLTGEVPGGFTSDNFSDVRTLTLNPFFRDYVGEAFRPLGVYVNFWQRTVPAGERRNYQVMIINDEQTLAIGKLDLRIESANGRIASRTTVPFAVAAAGQTTLSVPLTMPAQAGFFTLKAIAVPDDGSVSTISRRWISVRGAPK